MDFVISAEQAAALARSTLAAPEPAADVLRRLADVCRRSGALQAAGELLARYAEQVPPEAADPYALSLAAIFARRFGRTRADPAALTPTPFLVLRDLLPAPVLAAVIETTLAEVDAFEASRTSDGARGGVNTAVRSSRSLRDVSALKRLFEPHLKAVVRAPELAAMLGLDAFHPDTIEFQATAYGDGAFFDVHVDARPGFHDQRRATFVFYYHAPPKRFSGGDLLLFDGTPDGGYAAGAYTRVPPEQNSMVVFPSACAHKVEAVSTRSADPSEARFSLNGWL